MCVKLLPNTYKYTLNSAKLSGEEHTSILNVLQDHQAEKTLDCCCYSAVICQTSLCSVRSFQSREVIRSPTEAGKESKEHRVKLLPCLAKSLILTALQSEVCYKKTEEVREKQ